MYVFSRVENVDFALWKVFELAKAVLGIYRGLFNVPQVVGVLKGVEDC
jgi:hypothetical protein